MHSPACTAKPNPYPTAPRQYAVLLHDTAATDLPLRRMLRLGLGLFQITIRFKTYFSVYVIIGMFCLASTIAVYSCFEPIVMWSYEAFPRYSNHLNTKHLNTRFSYKAFPSYSSNTFKTFLSGFKHVP